MLHIYVLESVNWILYTSLNQLQQHHEDFFIFCIYILIEISFLINKMRSESWDETLYS